jgi:hypothetical protein
MSTFVEGIKGIYWFGPEREREREREIKNGYCNLFFSLQLINKLHCKNIKEAPSRPPLLPLFYPPHHTLSHHFDFRRSNGSRGIRKRKKRTAGELE